MQTGSMGALQLFVGAFMAAGLENQAPVGVEAIEAENGSATAIVHAPGGGRYRVTVELLAPSEAQR